MTDLYEMECAIRDAKQTIDDSKKAIRKMVSIIAGNLRFSECWGGDLKKLKKELMDYNMHTRKWKD